MKKRNIHEKVIEGFFHNTENKKEKSSKTKRIISRIIRLIIPPIFPFLFAYTGRLVLYLLPVLKDDFGITVTLFCAFILVPIYCLIYGISVAKNEKRKYLFAMYNPVVSCWYYFLGGFFPLIILAFGWFAFWTIIPVRIHEAIIEKLTKKAENLEINNSNEEVIPKNITDGSSEKKQEYIQEISILKKEYSTQMRRSIWRIIRLAIPFGFSYLWFILSETLNSLTKIILDIRMDVGSFIISFVVFPVSCYLYSYCATKHEKNKYFFALYYPVVSICSCLQHGFPMKDSLILPFVVVFFFISLLPVWIHNEKT